MILFGSVCSGIEAASVAWAQLGWKAAWLSEIEPFPCAVLAHHYPDVPNLGDMTLLPDRIRSGEVMAPDVFCGGTPCQAFSVAGLRKSLDDARGNLSLTFCEIANAIDSKRVVPSIIFWENVPGVLNTKDNAFGCFLGALAGEDDALTPPGGRWSDAGFIDGPQRAIAWRVLDAQHFGVAQRRKRVYVVASARADFDPASVLFEFEGLRRDTAPSREKGQKVAPAVSTGALFSRTGNERVECDAIVPVADPAYCLETTCNDYSRADGFNMIATPIALAENTIGRQPQNGGNGDGFTVGGPMYTLNATGVHGVAQPIAYAFDSLSSNSMKSSNPISGVNEVSVSKTLDTSRGLDPSCNQGGIGVAQPIGWSEELNALEGVQPTLQRGGQGGRHEGVMQTNMAVRRLTPVECERLQGFPDDYTNIPWRGKPEAPDGPRYKALGNSWAVPVITWIGKRIDNAIA